MGGAYGTPCSGEFQFWAVMQSQMHALVKQTTRIADTLAKRADCGAAVESAALRAGLESVRSVLKSWHCPDNETASKITELRRMCDALLDTEFTPCHANAEHYAHGLLAIRAITEDYADETNTLGTVYRTAKAFLMTDPAPRPQEGNDA